MNREFFYQALHALKLDVGWFNTIPRDFLYVAMLRNPLPVGDASDMIFDKYGTSNHQTLEFFGDRILSTIIATAIYQIIGLTHYSGYNTQAYSNIASNASLTSIALKENFCSALLSSIFCTFKVPTEKHNPCGDSIEAIIGACYFYGLGTGKIDIFQEVYNWFVSIPSVFDIIRKQFPDESEENIRKYLPLTTTPIVWDKQIDMSETSILWKSCEIPEMSKKAEELQQTPKAERLRLPFLPIKDERTEAFVKRLAQYYGTKALYYVDIPTDVPNRSFKGSGASFKDALISLIKSFPFKEIPGDEEHGTKATEERLYLPFLPIKGTDNGETYINRLLQYYGNGATYNFIKTNDYYYLMIQIDKNRILRGVGATLAAALFDLIARYSPREVA